MFTMKLLFFPFATSKMQLNFFYMDFWILICILLLLWFCSRKKKVIIKLEKALIVWYLNFQVQI